MLQKLSIALLYPQSEIFTRLRNDLQHATTIGLHAAGFQGQLEWHPEFINGADTKSVEQGLKKVIYHLDCQLAIVVANTRNVAEHASLIAGANLPVVVLNLGANLPVAEWANPFLFYNSLHSWKAQWALGYWAQQQYGGVCAVNTTLYEGGYLLHEAFRLGLGAGGAQTLHLNLVKNFGKMYDTTPLFQQLQQQSFSHVHAVLSGREGQDFLDKYQQTPAIRETPLTVNAFMVDDAVIAPHASMEGVVSASTWTRTATGEANTAFVEAYQHGYARAPHAFSLLGYETGLALGTALQQASAQDTGAFCAALEQVQPEGPRGAIHVSTTNMKADMPVHLFRTHFHEADQSLSQAFIGHGENADWKSPDLAASAQGAISGWQNPYLCL
jgi:branched-chain amino acid transport system substrate-binding protein